MSSATKALQVLASEIGAVVLADNQTHQCRMEIKSASSNRLYIVSKSKGAGDWQCSCPGWIMKRAGKERNCKHLKAIAPALSAIDTKLLGK